MEHKNVIMATNLAVLRVVFLILVTLVLEESVQVLIVRSDAEMVFLEGLNNAIMQIKMAVQLIVFLI